MFLESQPGVVLSCSKDTFVKVWDLSTQHCFKTMTGHLGEVGNTVIIMWHEYTVLYY